MDYYWVLRRLHSYVRATLDEQGKHVTLRTHGSSLDSKYSPQMWIVLGWLGLPGLAP